MLKALEANHQRDPNIAAKMAALHLALGNKIEALRFSEQALIDRPLLDARSAVRAMMTRGLAGCHLTYDARFRYDFLEALNLITQSGLEGTDIHAAMLINWASSQASMDDVPNAIETLKAAIAIERDLPEEWPLRKARLISCRLNLLLMQHTVIDQIVEGLLSLTASAEADDPYVGAICHDQLGQILGRNELYTGALHHATRAGALYEEAGRPSAARKARLNVAGIWLNLGMDEAGLAVLNEVPETPTDSGWRWATARAMDLKAEQSARIAAFDDAMVTYEAALKLIVDDVVLYPRLWGEESFTSILMGLMLTAGRARNRERLAFWRSKLDQLARRIEKLSNDMNERAAFKMIQYFFEEDEGKGKLLEGNLTQAAISSARSEEELTYLRGLLFDVPGLRLEVLGLLGTDQPESVDIAEYWRHVRHLTGEDDEVVRATYRRANLLPVLHRMLARQLAHPWDQFVAVELSRWGSLSGFLGATSMVDTRGRMRHSFVRNSGSRKITFPAALGSPMRLSHNGQISCVGAGYSAETIPFDELVARGDWPTDPDILQLYMRGHILHVVHFRLGGATAINRLAVDVGKAKAELLQHALIWSSPQPRQVDEDILTASGLPLEYLVTVAAIRCCLGPFVEDQQLASDYALVLPRRAVNAVFDHLNQVDVPHLDRIREAIGDLIPPFLMRPTSRPLLLSLSNELTQIPFLLAQRGTYCAALGLNRPVAFLPPINSLTAMVSTARNSSVRIWKLRTVGDTTHSLGFAAATDESSDVRNAFLYQKEEAAAEVAVVYSGHYMTESVLHPSRAALPGETEQPELTAAEVLRTHSYAPGRLALLSCQASGFQFTDEWGGIASALMIRGAREILAPSWVLIDAIPASKVDQSIAEIIVRRGNFAHIVHEWRQGMMDDWLSHSAKSIPPHWWAGLNLMKG